MRYFKGLVRLALPFLLLPLMVSEAKAAWGDYFCDIYKGSASDFYRAVDLYNLDKEDQRACKWAIRFKEAQRVKLSERVTIRQLPPEGQNYGFSIRKCVSKGEYAEPGCEDFGPEDILVDATGLGDCPIRVYENARVDFQNFTLIVDNPQLGICTGGGAPIPRESQSSPFAWIHNVQIVRQVTTDRSDPPTCAIQANTSSEFDGYKIVWRTTNATSISLRRDATEISTRYRGSLLEQPTSRTTYTVRATGDGGSCSDRVIVNPAPRPTCDITATESSKGGYDIAWKVTDANEISVREGTKQISTDVTGTVHVDTTSQLRYSVSATGYGGECSDSVLVTPPPAEPTCDIRAEESPDGGFDLVWTSRYGSAYAIADDPLTFIDLVPASGRRHVEPSVITEYTFGVNGPGGTCLDTVVVVPGPVAEPLCNITATPQPNGYFEVNWESTYANRATLSTSEVNGENNSDTVSTSGNRRIRPDNTTSLTLIAVGPGGECRDSVTVIPSQNPVSNDPPTCQLTATAGVQQNDFTLVWTTGDATNVTLSTTGGTSQVANSGNEAVSLTEPTTFTLQARNDAGNCESVITLTPGEAPPTVPTCDFSSAPSIANSTDLIWVTTNAAAVTLGDGATAEPVPTSGRQNVSPEEDTTYTLAAVNEGESASCSSQLTVLAVPVNPGPTSDCHLSATPADDGSFELLWTTTNASNVSLRDGASILSGAPSGRLNVTPGVATTYTVTAVSELGECTTSVELTPGSPVPPPAPICDLSSAPANTGFDLTWTTSGATGVSLTSGTTELSSDDSGTLNVTPVSATSYRLMATNSGGSCSETITIDPNTAAPSAPTCDLDAVVSGNGFDLNWATENATSVTLSDGTSTLSSDANPVDPVHVEPSVQTTYTLLATGQNGECSRSIVLTPGEAVPETPECDLNALSSGNGYDLSWTTSNATTVSVLEGSEEISSDANSSSPLHVTPVQATAYSLEASAAGGSCSESVTLLPNIVVPSAPTCDLDAVVSGNGFDLSWATENATSVTLSDGASTLSSDPNPVDPVHVEPAVETTYTLNATGPGGACVRSIRLTPGEPVPSETDCDLVFALSQSGVELSWTTANANSAELSDGTTVLSTELNRDAGNPVTDNPAEVTTYTLTATGDGGSCSDAIVVNPLIIDTDLDGIPDPVDLCPGESGTIQNGGCPEATKCISQADGLPRDLLGIDEDGDGIDAACDLNDTPTPPPPTPVCDLNAVRGAGESFDLEWTTTNATSVSLLEGSAEISNETSGTTNVTPAGETIYTLSAVGAGGTCSTSITLPVGSDVPPPPPTCGLSVLPGNNDSLQVTWLTTNAAIIELTDGTEILSNLPAGTINDTIDAETTYVLTASGAGGDCSTSLTVAPNEPIPAAPTCELSTSDDANGGFVLDWTTTNADPVTLSDGTQQLSSDASGSISVNPTSSTTYSLVGESAGGNCTVMVTLPPASRVVPPPPQCRLAAAINVENGFDITWLTSQADTVRLSDPTTTLSELISGTITVTPQVPTTYTLTATGVGGSCSTATSVGPGIVSAVDSDGDGLTDASEDPNGNGIVDEGETCAFLDEPVAEGVMVPEDCSTPADSDKDGVNDRSDCAPLDPTRAEADTCTFFSDDIDGDGFPNDQDNCPFVANDQTDSDQDGFGDACDTVFDESVNDADGDGLEDEEEDPNGNGIVDPGETCAFLDEPIAPEVTIPVDCSTPEDSDKDGLLDGEEVQSEFYPICGPLDPDCDLDGICDGPATVLNEDGSVVCTPFEGNGDNCILVSNGPNTPTILPEEIQLDENGDGVGDVCEGDKDGDGVPDQIDNCVFVANADQEDINNNDIGDVCDLSLAFIKGGTGCSLTPEVVGAPLSVNLLILLMILVPSGLMGLLRRSWL